MNGSVCEAPEGATLGKSNLFQLFCQTSMTTNVLVVVFSTVIFLSDFLTCLAMMRTQRLLFPVRLLTSITLICDSLWVFLFLVGFLTSWTRREGNTIVGCVFSQIGRLCVMISWVAVGLMSVDRVLCLNMGIYYYKYFAPKTAMKYIIGCLCFCVFVKLLARYIIVWLHDFDYKYACSALKFSMYILGICLGVNIPCYIDIIFIIIRHVRRQKNNCPSRGALLNKTLRYTRAISVLFVVFVVIHLPVLIVFITANVNNAMENFVMMISVLFMCGANPIIYAWRFKECRFVIKSLFSRYLGICSNNVQ